WGDVRAGEDGGDVFRIRESHVAMVQNVAALLDRARARAVRLLGMGVQKPVQHVDAVAIRFHDDVAERIAPDVPLPDLLFVRRGRRRRLLAAAESALDPVRMGHTDLADAARGGQLLRLAVSRPVALLESEGDVELAI